MKRTLSIFGVALAVVMTCVAARFVKTVGTLGELAAENPFDIYTNVWVTDYGNTNAGMFSWIPSVTNAADGTNIIESTYIATGRWFRVNALNTNSVPDPLFVNNFYSTNIVSTNITVQNFYAGDSYTTNLITTNFYGGNTYSSNFFTTNFYGGDVYVTNITTTNITTSILITTNVNNIWVFQDGNTFVSGDTFITNLTVENLTLTNLAPSQLMGTDSGTNIISVFQNTNQFAFETNLTFSIKSGAITTNLVQHGIISLPDTSGNYFDFGAPATDGWRLDWGNPGGYWNIVWPASPTHTFDLFVNGTYPLIHANGTSGTLGTTAQVRYGWNGGMGFDGYGTTFAGKSPLTTSATQGFFMIPQTPGPPTGVPETGSGFFSYHRAVDVDSTNGRFYFDKGSGTWIATANLSDLASAYNVVGWTGGLYLNSGANAIMANNLDFDWSSTPGGLTFLTTVGLSDWTPSSTVVLWNTGDPATVGDPLDTINIDVSTSGIISIVFAWFDSNTAIANLTPTTPFVDGVSYNIAVVINKSTDTATLYVDSQPPVTASLSSVAAREWRGNGPIEVLSTSNTDIYLRRYATYRGALSQSNISSYFRDGVKAANRYASLDYDLDLAFVNPAASTTIFDRSGQNDMTVSSGLQITPSEYLWSKRLDAGSLNLTGEIVFTPSSLQTLDAVDTISADAAALLVVGNGSPVTLTSTPSLSAGASGQWVMIEGHDDINTVSLQDETVLSGSNLHLAGPWTGADGSYIILRWDITNARWDEVSRSNPNTGTSFPTLSGVVIGNGGSAPTGVSGATNQVLSVTTDGSTYAFKDLVEGTGITIGHTDTNITISSTGTSFPNLTGMVIGNGGSAPTAVAGTTNQFLSVLGDGSDYTFKDLLAGTNIVLEHTDSSVTINASGTASFGTLNGVLIGDGVGGAGGVPLTTNEFLSVNTTGTGYVAKTLQAGTNVFLETTDTTVTINSAGGTGFTGTLTPNYIPYAATSSSLTDSPMSVSGVGNILLSSRILANGATLTNALGVASGGTGTNLSSGSIGGLMYRQTATNYASGGALTGILQGGGTGAPTAITGTTNQVLSVTTDGTGYAFKDLVEGSGVTISSTDTSVTFSASGSSPTATAVEVTGAGTDYTLTGTFAQIVFGTTSPVVTLPSAGTYELTALVAVSGIGSTSARNDFKFYNFTDTSDIGTTRGIFLNTSDTAQVELKDIVTVGGSTVIQIYGAITSSFSIPSTNIAAETSIYYVKLAN